MNTKINTYAIIDLLNNVASRGFTSEPVKHHLSKDQTELRCSFTDDEKKKINEFIAQNHMILRKIDYPMMSFMGEPERRTTSLLVMITYMISYGDSPEYVAQTCQKIEDIIEQLETPLE